MMALVRCVQQTGAVTRAHPEVSIPDPVPPTERRASADELKAARWWMRLVIGVLGTLYLITLCGGWIATARQGNYGIRLAPPWTIEHSGAQIVSIEPGGPADRAGLRPGDVLIAADGIPVTPSTRTWPTGGAEAVLLIRRETAAAGGPEGAPIEEVRLILQPGLTDPYYQRSLTIYSLVGLLLLSLTSAVALVRPNDLAARLLLITGSAFALTLSTATIVGAAPGPLWDLAHFCAAALTAAALLHLFLIFPTPHRLLARLRAIGLGWMRRLDAGVVLLYAPPLAVAAAVPNALSAPTSYGLSYAVDVLWALAACVVLASSYGGASSPIARAQLRWVLFGSIVCTVALGLAFVPGPLTGGRIDILPPEASVAIVALFPISIAIAILRYRLFDIDVLINRTIVYGAMTVILGSIFLGGSTLSQRALEAATGQRSDLLTVGVAVCVAAGFQPLRRRTKPIVDRFLPARQVLTLLFTDIVGSTQRAVELGDQRWREMLESYRAAVRGELRRFGGHEVDTSGDGFFATFHSPLRAVRCGQAIAPAGRDLGLDTRVGLHCGECEMRGEKVSGVNVHVAARVMALAGPGEVLISDTLREWLADDRVTFAQRGVHTLQGVPGEWRLYALVGA